MKLMTGCLVLAILGASTVADAWSWPWKRSRTPRLPKPIDSPIVRPRQEAEKATRQKHASKYVEGSWGQDKRNLQTKNPHEGNHSLFVD